MSYIKREDAIEAMKNALCVSFTGKAYFQQVKKDLLLLVPLGQQSLM